MQSNVLAEIGKGAFQNTAITQFTVPDTVDTLGAGSASSTGAKDGIFYGCSQLATVTIGINVETIRDCMFADCESLWWVVLKVIGKV